MIAWTTVEDAIHAWVTLGSGIPAARVVWSDTRGIARPTPPYITIALTAIRKIGMDWLTVHDNPTPDPGEEIVHTVRGRREMVLSMQCFDGAGTGLTSGPAILEALMQSVRLPSVHAGLRAAGVGVAGFEPIVPLRTAQLGAARFEPRAQMSVRAFVSSEVAEFTTYIQRVEVTREAPLPEVTFIVDRDA